MKPSSRKEVEQARAAAARAATRGSAMGALGFGLALIMGAILAEKGSFLALGLGLESLLLAGGLCGGLVFTFLAIRASRMVRRCDRELDGRGTRLS
ncbi:hypothetical protein [Nonomuraea sp. 10N515B]|uniref:hypothetical protein n=1 Tax=Nonomuraea sp. 10N515B TaxID=3457422 RepID=UPI003FCDC820